jgi:hypothetical protein
VALNQQFRLFWLGVGKDDTLTGPGARAFAEAIDKAGISFVFKETEDGTSGRGGGST